MDARRLSAPLLWLMVSALGLVPCLAHAQNDPAAAQALFEDGKRLMDEGQFDQACPKLAESQRLDPGGGTLLSLALCYERAGKTATAWEKYKEGLSVARRDGRQERIDFAEEGIGRVEPKLSRLTILVPEGARVPALVVTRNGVQINEAAWGLSIPIDPGAQEVAAQAPEHEPWKTTIEIGAEADNQAITIPVLVPTPTAPAPPAPAASSTTAPAADQAPGSGEPDDGAAAGEPQRTIGWITMGIGGAAALVGGVFGVLALSEDGDADELCGDGSTTCPTQEGLDASEAARRNATVANALVFGGLGLAGAGLIILLTAPDGAEASDQATLVAPWAGPDGGGLSLQFDW